MALLRNLEQSLSGLVEGTIGRVFRTEVRPTEIARKLAREMEINKRVSLSRTYAPTDYLVYLSPEDRGRYAGVEASIAEELGAYLLEHARRERLVLVRRPLVEFRTDQRLRLGEFGIEARTAPISAAEAPPRDGAQPTHQPTDRDHPPGERRTRRAERPEAASEPQRPLYDDDIAPERNLYDDADGLPAPPSPQPAVPLGAEPDPEYPGDAPAIEHDDAGEEPYEDPYANDFGGGQDESAEFEWQDPPARERAPEPEPLHEPDPEPAAAQDPDWLDPVEDWAPPEPSPVAPSPVAPSPVAPSPVAPANPLAGAPWIDPTSRRQKRPQFAPPQIPAKPGKSKHEPAHWPAAEAQSPAEAAPRPTPPRAPDTVLLVDGTPHELHGDRMVLGRSRTADIVISDASVSRQHVELRRDDRGWYAVDLGSTNGSELGGHSLSEPRRLEVGQRLKLGHADAIIEVR